jgi:hypothetical protein
MALLGNSFTWALVSTSILIIALFLRLVQRYLVLSQIPGPRLAAWSDLWLFKQRWYGRNANELIDYLGQYGPLVRYGPKRVLFSDPSYITTVYGTTKVYDKVSPWALSSTVN